MVLGFKAFDPEVEIAGIIVNNLGSLRHTNKVKEAIEKLAVVPVVGTIPREDLSWMPHCRSGLVPMIRRDEVSITLPKFQSLIEEHVDIPRILEIACNAEDLPYSIEVREATHVSGVHVGLLYDPAFSFYYPESIEALQALCGKVSFINSLEDPKLPDGLDGLYIGGGFPEIYAAQLERNKGLKSAIKEAALSGLPIYAECGGLMYLCSSIITCNGDAYEMAGFFDGYIRMFEKPQALGYVQLLSERDSIIAKRGDVIKAHEFHCSKIKLREEPTFAYQVLRGRGMDGRHDGLTKSNILASYAHIHVASYPDLFKNFIKRCLSN